MPKVLNIIIVAVMLLVGLGSMGAVGLYDSLKRPEYCINCHSDPYYNSWEDSNLLAASHGKAAIRCQTCHPRSLGTAMANIVTELKGNVRLRKLRVSKEACFKCHAHADYAELVERTKYINPNIHIPGGDPSASSAPTETIESNSSSSAESSPEGEAAWVVAQNPHHFYHWGEMDCRICHKMHRASEDYCSECHEPSASGAGWIIQVRRKGHIPAPTSLPPIPEASLDVLLVHLARRSARLCNARIDQIL